MAQLASNPEGFANGEELINPTNTFILKNNFTFDNLHYLWYMVRLSHVTFSCNLIRMKMYIIYLTKLQTYVGKLQQIFYMVNR